MLRTRKRLAMSEKSKQEDRCHQRSDADVELETFTKLFKSRSSAKEQASPCMDHTQVIVKPGDHLVKETSSHKKKKRKPPVVSNNTNKNEGKSNDFVDTNPHIVTTAKKAKKKKSNNDSVVQPTENARYTNSKKPCNAAVEISGRKRKKQKIDPDGSKLKASVSSSLKSESDSVAEKIASASNSVEMPSPSSVSDLQHMEDSVIDDYAAIRNELSNMPIADLLQLKERLGAKVYDEVMFGSSKRSKVSQKKFARENKNRPMEMSSKRPLAVGQQEMQSKKHAFAARDPRFDDLSGEFNESYFKQSYGFLSDIKLREKQKVLNMLKKTKDANKSVQLQQLLTRMTQQEKAEKEREAKRHREQALKKKEKERISQGKRPFFLKKSEKRKLELAEKFKQLEKSGKLEQFIAKKKKKNLRTEQKSLPHT